jgi:hypothetical protein
MAQGRESKCLAVVNKEALIPYLKTVNIDKKKYFIFKYSNII